MLCIEIIALLVTASAEGKRKVPRQLNSIGKLKNILFCSFFGNRKIAFKNRLLNIWAYIKVELYIIYSKAVYQISSCFFFILVCLDQDMNGMQFSVTLKQSKNIFRRICYFTLTNFTFFCRIYSLLYMICHIQELPFS